MDNKEMLTIIEESMDLEEGTLSLDDVLKDYDEWDSLAYLSLAAFCSSKCGKTIKVSDIKKMNTVADLLKLMEE